MSRRDSCSLYCNDTSEHLRHHPSFLQIFPGGYPMCQPGPNPPNCVTASPGRRLLYKGASAQEDPRTRTLLGDETRNPAFIYPVEPDTPPLSQAAPGKSFL